MTVNNPNTVDPTTPNVAPDAGTRYFSDARSANSWYLAGSRLSDLRIDVESVWDEYKGEGINIGVIDSQIDFRHQDLDDNYNFQLDFDFARDTSNPTIGSGQRFDGHGTMVAGVIGAEANGVGMVGIAPESSIAGLAIDYEADDVMDQIQDALRMSSKLDVVNGSWSYSNNFGDNFLRQPEFEAALRAPVETGRDGLGTVVVFSAGNVGETGTSNYHNFQNSPYAIAVGAVAQDGSPAGFTSIGANVLVSAAGVNIPTTGWDGRYYEMNGTSFSAPAVSAVAGLMLEANSELGYRDVQQILAISARREGLSDEKLHGDGWQINGADNVNGGGMHHSDAFGYGFLNAHDAVRLAETWVETQSLANRSSLTLESGLSRVQFGGGAGDIIEHSFEVTKPIEVEHVELTLDLRWKNSADLDIYLTSPDGTRVRMAYDLPADGSAGDEMRPFRLSSVATMGEMGEGSWKVEIINRDPDASNRDGSAMTGALNRLDLTLHGDTDGLADDVYFYTDELSNYAGDALLGRQTLTDTDGGTDAINAAAVTSDSTIDLSGGRTEIDGVALRIKADTIENAFAGDGDDTLIGSGGDNWLRGGRGNDVIHLSAGRDVIDGGAGTDTLAFGASVGQLAGYVEKAGTLMLGLVKSGLSAVTDVEFYEFTDVTYSFDQLVSVLDDSPVAEQPDPEPEKPVTEPEKPEPEAPVTEPEPEPEAPVTTPEPEPEPEPEAPDTSRDLEGSAGNDKLRGNGENDRLLGLEGNDRLFGKDGIDVLEGGADQDALYGGDGGDWLYGGTDGDKLTGEGGRDMLFGGHGIDVLRGGAGDDVLSGGAGADYLRGGGGADEFCFGLDEIGATDVIRDFDAAEGDSLMLTGLAANGADVAVELVTQGRSQQLQVELDGKVYVLAELQGAGRQDIVMQQMNEDMFVFA